MKRAEKLELAAKLRDLVTHYQERQSVVDCPVKKSWYAEIIDLKRAEIARLETPGKKKHQTVH